MSVVLYEGEMTSATGDKAVLMCKDSLAALLRSQNAHNELIECVQEYQNAIERGSGDRLRR